MAKLKVKLPPRETVSIGELRCEVSVSPMGKPRQTQSDKWKQRPVVIRSRLIADQIRESFGLKPMEKFESAGKIAVYAYFQTNNPDRFNNLIHTVKPDASNVLKLVEDSILDHDEKLHSVECVKEWTERESSLVIFLSEVKRYA
jgi:Holliday junction resolvase RusA-like endonuclease